MTHTILIGDAREQLATLPDASVQTCVTSPPYWNLRSYLDADEVGKDREIGTEKTVEEYIDNLLTVFREVWRVLRDDGTIWVNLGSTYGKGKQLVPVPWLFGLAMQQDGWILRMDHIWSKPNAIPEPVRDRCTRSHEYVLMFAKREHYHYDSDAILEPFVTPNGIGWAKTIATQDTMKTDGDFRRAKDRKGEGMVSMKPREGGRNKRSVWEVNTSPYPGQHHATFPPKLITPCILAGSHEGDTVLDPFCGSGTTIMVAERHARHAIGIDLDPDNRALIAERTAQRPLWDTLKTAD